MKYKLTARVTVSCYTEVEADSLEEAIELSKEKPGALYFNGSGAEPEDSWLVEEVDGEPYDITES